MKFDIALQTRHLADRESHRREHGQAGRARCDRLLPVALQRAREGLPELRPRRSPARSPSRRVTGPTRRAGSGSPPCTARGVVTARIDIRDVSHRVRWPKSIKGRSDRDQLMTYDHIYPSMYNGLKAVDIPQGSDFVRRATCCSTPAARSLSGWSTTVRQAGDDCPGDRPAPRLDRPRRRIISTTRASPGRRARTGQADGRSSTQQRGRKIGASLSVPPDGSKDGDVITLTLRPDATLTGRRGRRDGQSGRRFYPGQSRPHRQAVSR